MTMIRKIKRSVARYNIEQQDIDIFGKYAPKETIVRGGCIDGVYTKKPHRATVSKSFFARSWRAYL